MVGKINTILFTLFVIVGVISRYIYGFTTNQSAGIVIGQDNMESNFVGTTANMLNSCNASVGNGIYLG